MRNGEVRKIALAAMFTAVSAIICLAASFMPTMSLSITAVAGIATAIAIVNLGYKYTCLVYLATSVILWMMSADIQCALFYTVLFGHYPMLKLLTERIGNRIFILIFKIAEINILFAIVCFIMCFISGITGDMPLVDVIFYWIAFNLLFFLYDICIGRISFLYIARTSKNNRFH